MRLSEKKEITLYKKWSFPLWISLVNVTKSAGNSGFGRIYLKNPELETSFFLQWVIRAWWKVDFSFRAKWLLWTQHKFALLPIEKLDDHHTFIIGGAVPSQWQTVTTFDVCRICCNIRMVTNLDNIAFKIFLWYFVRNPDISTFFLLLQTAQENEVFHEIFIQ